MDYVVNRDIYRQTSTSKQGLSRGRQKTQGSRQQQKSPSPSLQKQEKHEPFGGEKAPAVQEVRKKDSKLVGMFTQAQDKGFGAEAEAKTNTQRMAAQYSPVRPSNTLNQQQAVENSVKQINLTTHSKPQGTNHTYDNKPNSAAGRSSIMSFNYDMDSESPRKLQVIKETHNEPLSPQMQKAGNQQSQSPVLPPEYAPKDQVLALAERIPEMQFDDEEAADAEAEENAKVTEMAYNLSKVQHTSSQDLEVKRDLMASVETAEFRDKVHSIQKNKKRSEEETKAVDQGSRSVEIQNSDEGMKPKRSSRGLLKVRSASSMFSKMNKSYSRVLDDPNESFDFFYKFIIIGDEKVGKSNFLSRVTRNKFVLSPKITYGVEFDSKIVPLPNSNQRVRVQLWDTSGAKQFLSITTTHYRFAVGAVLIYDITNLQSFMNLREWVDKIREYSDEHVQIALVANKRDLVEGSFTGKSLFKDLIDDNEDEPGKKKQRIDPGFKIESLQYEGGSPTRSTVSKKQGRLGSQNSRNSAAKGPESKFSFGRNQSPQTRPQKKSGQNKPLLFGSSQAKKEKQTDIEVFDPSTLNRGPAIRDNVYQAGEGSVLKSTVTRFSNNDGSEIGKGKPTFTRQVSVEQAEQFAREQNLIFLGETSCYDNLNNCLDVFYKLLGQVHSTQTQLVRDGMKSLEDIQFGEEERHVRYDRCCY